MTRNTARAATIAWLLAALVLCLVGAQGIARLWFPDPDDAMRLLEVRDWLSGQSFWDVAQHRLVGPTGVQVFAMHWSRIVDLPLAAIMGLLDPIVGRAAATRAATTVVPLLLLLAVMLLITRITATLADVERAKLAALLVPLAPPVVFQLRPMRIDHHGWQVMLALAAVAALLSRPTRRSGAIAGLALAVLVSVSLEGMPITAAVLGVALLAWAYDPARQPQAAAMTAALLGGVTAIHVVQRGPAMLAPACDAIAPAWIGALTVASVVIAVTLWRARGLGMRVGGIVAAAVLGATTLRLAAPLCTRGPFATLDPLVYTLWYRNIAEGLPAWAQTPGSALMIYALPPVGLIGALAGWRASAGEVRLRWSLTASIAAAAFAFSLLVARGAATANALAIPGVAWLLHGWLIRARAIPPLLPRIAATAAALLAAAPGLAAIVLVSVESQARKREVIAAARASGVEPCDMGREVADLGRLPPGLVYAPLDISPTLLAWTGHRAIASGYHRNAASIHAVLGTFLAPPEVARRAVLASGADYVAGCPGENETEIYKHYAPNGLWARLERGEQVAWLQPIPMNGSPVLAWRVVRPQIQRLPGSGARP